MAEVNALSGPGVPLPQDMPVLPDDLTIIERLIDANCRAYNEQYGYHLDSRCLSHYNEGIVRLAQAGRINLIQPTDAEGAPLATLYEEVTDSPAQAVRVRAGYVSAQVRVTRPTQDPVWNLRAAEIQRLQDENARLRAEKDLPPGALPPWLLGPTTPLGPAAARLDGYVPPPPLPEPTE